MLFLLALGAQASAQDAEWKTEPYLRPVVGLSLYSSGGRTSSVVGLGAEVGVRYWQRRSPSPPRWGGKTRVRGVYGLGSSDIQYADFRLGSFFGPTWGVFSVDAGPDIFWNRLLVSGVGLEPSLGVGVPVIASLDFQDILLYGGFEPAWLFNSQRQVDWSTVNLFGFGHEFAYLAGIMLDLDSLRVSLSYRYQIVASGEQQSIGIGLHL